MDGSLDSVRKAEFYHDMGLWKESEAIFIKMIQDNPKDFYPYYKLGCLQEELLEYQQAYQYYISALQLSPNNFNILYKLAGLSMLNGDMDEAAEYYRQCLVLNEGSLRANYNLGLIFYRKNDWINAANYFSTASELGEDYPDIWYMLGTSLMAIGRWPQALEALLKAVRVSPDRAEIHYNLGIILLHQQQFQDAEKSLLNAVKVAPDNPQYLLGLGKLYFQWGKNEEARKTLDEVMSVAPNNETAQLLLNALNGQQVSRVPGELLTTMFDHCSETFDSYMVNELKYCLPKKLHEAVAECCRHYKQPQQFDMVLDLGCGTGLAAEQFMMESKNIIGVDISPGMIEHAKAKKIYQRLICGDLVSIMESAVNKYDLVVASDVFIYIGDLEKTFEAVSGHLQPGAFFAFSIEREDETADYVLSRSGVFAHSPEYIVRLAKKCGLEDVLVRPSGNENFPNVLIYVLRKG